MPTPHKSTPRWQSIAVLPLITRVIDGQLEAAEEQHRLLRLARPGSLDNPTVDRVVQVFAEEVQLLAVYSEQLDRWRSGLLSVTQRLEVERCADSWRATATLTRPSCPSHSNSRRLPSTPSSPRVTSNSTSRF